SSQLPESVASDARRTLRSVSTPTRWRWPRAAHRGIGIRGRPYAAGSARRLSSELRDTAGPLLIAALSEVIVKGGQRRIAGFGRNDAAIHGKSDAVRQLHPTVVRHDQRVANFSAPRGHGPRFGLFQVEFEKRACGTRVGVGGLLARIRTSLPLANSWKCDSRRGVSSEPSVPRRQPDTRACPN